MNYYSFKLTDENGFYFYFISPFDGSDMDLVSENIEHYVANQQSQMNQYLMTVDFDAVKIEKVDMPPSSILSKAFQPDDKNMLVSNEYASLIPPPKAKRASKPKSEDDSFACKTGVCAANKPKPKPKPKGAKKEVQQPAEPVAN